MARNGSKWLALDYNGAFVSLLFLGYFWIFLLFWGIFLTVAERILERYKK